MKTALIVFFILSIILVQIFVMMNVLIKYDEDDLLVIIRCLGAFSILIISVADKLLKIGSDTWVMTIVGVLIFGVTLIIIPWPFVAVVRKSKYKNITYYLRELLIFSFVICFIINIALWFVESKKNVSEDIIMERLIGTTFVNKNDDNKCIIVTNNNVISFDYTIKPKYDMEHICEINFTLEAGNCEGTYIVNGTLVLRYDKDDERTWICDELYSNEYNIHHVNWYTLH